VTAAARPAAVTRGGRIVLAFRFSTDDTDVLRAAVNPGFELAVIDDMDQRAIDAAIGPGVVGLIGQHRPTDLQQAFDLRWQQALSAGVEHLLRSGDWPRTVTLTNAKGVYATAIGQYVIGAILRVAEQVDVRSALQRDHRWPEDENRFTGRQVRGTTIVVVGYGGIGREIARLAAAFGMRVLAVTARPERRTDDAYRVPGTGDPEGAIPERIAGLDQLAETVAEADFVAVTVPLTPGSRGLVDRSVLAALREGAWIINTGRGPVIDQDALLETLSQRRIGGAVLDVFDEEPLPPDHPLWTAPGAILTPHVSGSETGTALRDLVAENLGRFTSGRSLVNVVDPVRGY
jgi:phosphoglycerate dehydrogenase-like enzyme